MQQRKKLLIAIIVSTIIAAGGGTTYWSIKVQRRNQQRIVFRAWEQDRFLDMLKTCYFLQDSLPENWQEFEASGAYAPDPDEIDGFNRLYPRESTNTGLRQFTESVLQDALAAAEKRIPAWDDELLRGRRQLEVRQGDLRAQLDLFLDPAFDRRVARPFFDDLRDRRGVMESTILEFLRANRLLCDAYAYMDNPDAPFNDPSLKIVLQFRAEEQAQKSHDELVAVRDDILRQAKPDGPATKSQSD